MNQKIKLLTILGLAMSVALSPVAVMAQTVQTPVTPSTSAEKKAAPATPAKPAEKKADPTKKTTP
jgi:hypothetical protein